MRFLITGSRGFLGQALGHAAAARGYEVVGLSRSAQPAVGWPGMHRCVDVVDDDLVDVLGRCAPDAVVHAAGPASVGDSFLSPVAGLRASLLSWANVLDAVRRTGLPARSVLLSSAAVYGQPAQLPVCESAAVQPISPYGYAKVMAETLAAEYSSCFGLDVLACRLFSVMGPGQRRLLPWEVFHQINDRSVTEIVLRGSSKATRDYLHVDDVASAVVSLCESATTPPVINVASGESTTIGDVAAGLVDAAGSEKPLRFLENQTAGDPDHWQGDTTVLNALLPAWTPRSLAASLADCVEHWSSS